MDRRQARILVSNDDGINAPGIEALEKIAKKFSDDIWIGTDRDEDPFIKGSDLKAVNEGHISITPLCLDLTHRLSVARLRKLFP